MAKMDFTDVTPLLIYLNGEKWTHPYIKDWYHPDAYDDTYDTSMYHIELGTDKDSVIIFFKSRYLSERCDAFYSRDDWEDLPKNTLFEDPYVNCNSVMQGVHMTLFEDFWCPTKPVTRTIKTASQYAKWREECPTYQFRFSEFGERIVAALKDGYDVTRFTPDCGLTTDGKEWWCDS